MREVAAAKLQVESLQRWWCKKFNRPMKDPLLQTYTPEELQIEYFMDLIEDDPNQAFPQGSDVQFRTGDTTIDKWEQLKAEGRDDEINYDEGIDPKIAAYVKAESRRKAAEHFPVLAQQAAKEAGKESPLPVDLSDLLEEDKNALDGFSDDYTEDE